MPLQIASANPAELSPSGPWRAVKQLGLILLCAAWILPGLVGHDPWKTEDATAFGVVWGMVQGGSPLVPNLAGEPYVDAPPLVYATAAAFVKLLSPPLPAHDAARLAAGIFLAITLFALALTARELYDRSFRWLPVLLFIGSVGLWDRAHQLSPDIGLIAGVAVSLYGFARIARRPVIGGAWVGLGVAIAFLARGFMGPLWLTLTALVLPLAFATWRTRGYALAMIVALPVALALGGAWPLALMRHAPDHLAAWWQAQSIGAYFLPLASTTSGDPFYLVKNLPWFAWPALPLVFWTLWTRGRGFNGGLAIAGIELAATLSLVMIVCLVLMAEPRAIYAMPLLLPLCLLAALEVDTLPRGFSGALDWFGILTFGLLAAIVWAVWIDAYTRGTTPWIARLFRDTEIGYHPPFHWFALAVSAFLTILWLVLVRPARRSNRRAVLNWAAGMTLLWGLYMTIWLPYLDSRRSYRPVALALAASLRPGECVASRNLGEPQRALFYYFGNVTTVREEDYPRQGCSDELVQYTRADGDPTVPVGWDIAWEGHRQGDDTERFILFRKRPS